MTNGPIIPIIRKLMPAMIAKDIVGAQPMSSAIGKAFDIHYKRPVPFCRVDQELYGLPPAPEGFLTVDVNYQVALWIKDQPVHMWKFSDAPAYSIAMTRYTISEKLYTLMAMRFE